MVSCSLVQTNGGVKANLSKRGPDDHHWNPNGAMCAKPKDSTAGLNWAEFKPPTLQLFDNPLYYLS